MPTISIRSKVYLDTAYAIALSATRDFFHERAIELANEINATRTTIVTSRAVLLEIGNALCGLRYRAAAVGLMEAVETDPNVEVVPLTDDLWERAFQLFKQRPDKRWGLVDCVSCIVMQDRGITDALTTDEHFQQMGFRVLLRHDID